MGTEAWGGGGHGNSEQGRGMVQDEPGLWRGERQRQTLVWAKKPCRGKKPLSSSSLLMASAPGRSTAQGSWVRVLAPQLGTGRGGEAPSGLQSRPIICGLFA